MVTPFRPPRSSASLNSHVVSMALSFLDIEEYVSYELFETRADLVIGVQEFSFPLEQMA